MYLKQEQQLAMNFVTEELPITIYQNAPKANGSHDFGTNEKGASMGGHCFGPSHRFINRSPIFYNSSFSCHAGLPANRILAVLL
jgi:hypothetical protein